MSARLPLKLGSNDARGDNEVWRPVVGHEELYEVSDRGRVRSRDRQTGSGYGSTRMVRGRILRLRDKGGYKRFHASDCGVARDIYVHHAVLEAFVGACPEGMEACHNDGNPSNNRLDNLRWDTHWSNILDKQRHGTDHYASRTHCVHNHEFTPENTIRRPEGGRKCRACSHINAARQREREKMCRIKAAS